MQDKKPIKNDLMPQSMANPTVQTAARGQTASSFPSCCFFWPSVINQFEEGRKGTETIILYRLYDWQCLSASLDGRMLMSQ
jgi:hypothetical protein